MSWYPGFDVAKARAGLYNDLPAVSFDKGEVESNGPDDAIADEAAAVLSGQPTASREQFNLSPITLDQPFFYAVLRLDRIGTILKRLEILPQAEVGALVNLAVLAQAVVIATIVLLVPLAAPGRIRVSRAGVLRSVVYFPALALGFLFIEIYLIEKASFWLGDRTNGFAMVLTGMLIFSGLGSLCSPWFESRPRQGMALAAGVVLVWCAAVMLLLEPAMLDTLDWPFAVRAALLLGVIAPVSVALGLPFPLGLNSGGDWWVPALGMGAERRVFRRGDAAGQPHCARGWIQQGSFVRGDPLWHRLDCVSGIEEKSGLARNLSTITRRGVISAAAVTSVLPPVRPLGAGLDEEPRMSRRCVNPAGRSA